MKRMKARLGRIVALCVMLGASFAHGQTYTDLFDLTQTTGSVPGNPNMLAQGRDANLYSTMPSSFPGFGTVVVSSPGGVLQEVHYFQGTADGAGPQSGLTLGLDGNFYGSTGGPTTSGSGEVFQVTPGGTVTVLYNFTNTTDGGFPWAPPIMASDGNLYGVTRGTTPVAYKIAMPAKAFSVLANLPAATAAPLIIGTDGNFYGTTGLGGKFNEGTVFKLTKKGVLTILYSFAAITNDGTSPDGLLQGADGKLYGATYWGGSNGLGTIYTMTTAGGSYKILHNFSGTDGQHPPSAPVQGADNFLYGVTNAGGTAGGFGTFFKMNTSGTTFLVQHNFDGKTTGGNPNSNLLLHTNGTFYGWDTIGPKEGALFSMNVGLKPFASLVILTSGKVGTKVGILGQGFSSVTGVRFGTGPGTFTVLNDTFMTAAPAAGATTGKVTVLEPSGNLITLQKFKIVPSITGFSPASGPVGTTVVITGMSLSQTTGVKFGTVAAAFTVNSNTQVTATVPAGAVTSKISVTTQGGTATSATSFTVN